MPELLTDSAPPAPFSPGDIVYALFKHKWKILFGALIGAAAAFLVFSLYTPLYESNAKLLVRYVIDRSTIDPEAPTSAGSRKSADLSGSVIGAEVQILTSWDLAMEVVEAIGVKRLLPNAPEGAKTEAAATVTSGLKALSREGSNMIWVSYTNKNPELATLVLNELVTRYFNKHLEVHRSAGAFDFVSQQTDQVRARLNETEDALRALKAKAGIISLTDSYAALSKNLSAADDQIYAAEEELSLQKARVVLMEQAAQAQDPEAAKNKPGVPASGDIQAYRALVGRLAALRGSELELLARYTPENSLVKIHQDQIQRLEQQRAETEAKFPGLAEAKEESAPATLAGERAKVAGMEAKIQVLKARLEGVRERARKLSEIGSEIADLERNQELQLNSYKYFKSTLEKARIDEALDPSKIPNITAVQRPTPPRRVYGKRDKVVMGLAGGGLGAIVVLVLLGELILNQSVKRSLDLEKRLGTPLLVSIPYDRQLGQSRRRLLKWRKDGEARNGQLAPWEANHFIRPFAVAIRDRLGLYFELNRMTHKPKLVGVTGFTEGSGTSTLAAGLAAALSEMGDGKVLLVDVNLGAQEVHPFFQGRPAVSLHTALKQNGEENKPAADNLYLATVARPEEGPAQLGLKKFFDLMPNLKASDFDYIIFDMPPLGQTSPTVGMAGFMDKVLLIVEAERNSRDAVKRGFEALSSQRDNVSVIFNKARSYTPKWLNGDS